jgi:transposase
VVDLYEEEQQILQEAEKAFGLCKRVTQPTVVVLDNAPAHRGKDFQAKVREWQDLHLLFPPAYSPETQPDRAAVEEDQG